MSLRAGIANTATLFTLLVIVSALGPGIVSAQSSEAPSVGVSQEDECVEVTAYGEGNKTVESFYDYRTYDGQYSSHGTKQLQRPAESQLFIYNGSEGISLVFLHNALGDNDAGGTITMTVSGLPGLSTDHDWAVEDDDYGKNTDDNFSHANTSSYIEWVWQGGRNDGGAVRGLDNLEGNVTIDPAFNEESARWDDWDHTGEGNRIKRWFARSSNGDTYNLSMSAPVSINPDGCVDGGVPEETCIADAVSGDDNEIDLGEIQQAIDWWANDEEVPNTGGETISLSKIQALIDAWANDTAVSCVDG